MLFEPSFETSTTIWASTKDGDGFDSSTGELSSYSHIAQTIYELSSPRTSPSQDLLAEDLVTSNISQTYGSSMGICITLCGHIRLPLSLTCHSGFLDRHLDYVVR